jgi:hypothetical protein
LTSSIGEAGPHITAIIDQLEAELPPNILVRYGIAPTENPPYVSIFPDAGLVDSSRLCMSNNDIQVGFLVHAVGVGPEQCMWAMDKTRAALVGQVLPVPGRVTHRITQSLGPQPMTRDLTSQPPVWLQVAGFSISSQRGGT